MDITVKIVYYPLILTSETAVETAVEKAINYYLNGIEYNGAFVSMQMIDQLQSIKEKKQKKYTLFAFRFKKKMYLCTFKNLQGKMSAGYTQHFVNNFFPKQEKDSEICVNKHSPFGFIKSNKSIYYNNRFLPFLQEKNVADFFVSPLLSSITKKTKGSLSSYRVLRAFPKGFTHYTEFYGHFRANLLIIPSFTSISEQIYSLYRVFRAFSSNFVHYTEFYEHFQADLLVIPSFTEKINRIK